jgi:hypothetical protein
MRFHGVAIKHRDKCTFHIWYCFEGRGCKRRSNAKIAAEFSWTPFNVSSFHTSLLRNHLILLEALKKHERKGCPKAIFAFLLASFDLIWIYCGCKRVIYIPICCYVNSRASYNSAHRMHSWNLGCTNPWLHVERETKFCTVAASVCGSSMWNLLPVALLVLRILRWLSGF